MDIEIPEYDKPENKGKRYPYITQDSHSLGFYDPKDFFNVYTKQPKPAPSISQIPLKFKHITGREFEARNQDDRYKYLAALKLHIRDPRNTPAHGAECLKELNYMRFLYYRHWKNTILNTSDCPIPDK